MHIYEQIDDVVEIMWGNAMEAAKYAREAHELKEDCRAYADWCRDMSIKHLEFNTAGKAVYERMKERLHEHGESEHAKGLLMVLDRQMNKLSRQHAETKAMLDAYK